MQPLSPRSPRSPRLSEQARSEAVGSPFDSLPPELLAACLAQLPLDCAARASCVARAWRAAALEPLARWLELRLSADATAEWLVPVNRTTVTELLERVAALTNGAGAHSLDLTGHTLLETNVHTSWLYNLIAKEASRGGSLRAVIAPDCTFWPVTAAAVCDMAGLKELTVGIAASGSETGESLTASLATPALRAHAFLLSSCLVLCPPPERLAAALAPQMQWLRQLDLSASGLHDEHVEALAPLLAGARALQQLDLSENALSAECIAPLVVAVLPREGGALCVLDLSGNALVQRSADGPPSFDLTALLTALRLQHEFELRRGPTARGARPHPLRRLVVQSCAPTKCLELLKEHALATEVAFGFGSHAWRLWGAV